MSFCGGQDNFDSPHSTFRTFGAALVTLTRCATVDSWENVLYAARAHSPYAPVYFLSFMVFGSMVMVNLFIAVVLVSAVDDMHGCVFLSANAKGWVVARCAHLLSHPAPAIMCTCMLCALPHVLLPLWISCPRMLFP